MYNSPGLSSSMPGENSNHVSHINKQMLVFFNISKKSGYLLFLLSLSLLVSCQSQVDIPEGFYPYEKEKVAEAIQQVSFNPEVPNYVPIPVEFIISDHYLMAETRKEALDISFYSRENDLLTYQVTEGHFESEQGAESIEIDSSILAHYCDNGFAKVLVWEKDGLSYKLEFRSSIIGDNQSSHSITKEDLVRVAQSCQS